MVPEFGLGEEPIEQRGAGKSDHAKTQKAGGISEELNGIAGAHGAERSSDAGCRPGETLGEIVPAGAARQIGDDEHGHDAEDPRPDAVQDLDAHK